MEIPFDASPNRSSRSGVKITHIVIHAMDGSFDGTVATFKRGIGKNRVSAHYLIGKKGQILQMVRDEDKAWHVCDANPFCIGIEHEDAFFTRFPGPDSTKPVLKKTKNCITDPGWVTPAMLTTSVQLTVALMKKFGIPKENVIGHNNPLLTKWGNNHSDPGPYWPWLKFFELVDAELINDQSVRKGS